MRNWLGESREGIGRLLAARGEPAYRAGQFWDWLHGKRADSFALMQNLPENLRRFLEEEGRVRSLGRLEHRVSADRLTEKWLFAAGPGDGAGLVETVLIRERREARRTVCLSSMAGCPLGCAFCATGRLGFERNLSAAEILEQAYAADARAREDGGRGVDHAVFMGMGEPLLNPDAALAAAGRLADPSGMGLSGRRITISTVGVPEGIARLAASGVNCRLAFSLHAPNQELRERLIPAAKRWPLPAVLAALKDFSLSARRELTVEYCLIDGVNASRRDAGETATLLAGIPCKVNLIPLNPVEGFPHSPPPPAKATAFRDALEAKGIPATIRVEKGADIGAACGQLKGVSQSARGVAPMGDAGSDAAERPAGLFRHRKQPK